MRQKKDIRKIFESQKKKKRIKNDEKMFIRHLFDAKCHKKNKSDEI